MTEIPLSLTGSSGDGKGTVQTGTTTLGPDRDQIF